MGEQKFVLIVQSMWLRVGLVLWQGRAECQGVERMLSPSLLWQDKGDIKLAFRIAERYLYSIDKTMDFSQSFATVLSWSVIGRTKVKSRWSNHFLHSCLKPTGTFSPHFLYVMNIISL